MASFAIACARMSLGRLYLPTSSVLATITRLYPSREFELRQKNPISAVERQEQQVVKTIKSVSEPYPGGDPDIGAGCGGFWALCATFKTASLLPVTIMTGANALRRNY